MKRSLPVEVFGRMIERRYIECLTLRCHFINEVMKGGGRYGNGYSLVVAYGTLDNPTSATAMAARVVTYQQHDIDEIRSYILAQVLSTSVPLQWVRFPKCHLASAVNLTSARLKSMERNNYAPGGLLPPSSFRSTIT